MSTARSLPPLLLTGGPAAGKSTTARALALERPTAACVDVDDVRHLVVAGHLAPWDGPSGAAQQELGVRNACAVAGNLLSAGFDLTLCDVVDERTVGLYRRLLPGVVVVHLGIDPAEARQRATSRPVWLSPDEFAALHDAQAVAAAHADVSLRVDGLTHDAQVALVRGAWPGAQR